MVILTFSVEIMPVNRRSAGFSLVELSVVIAIIGVILGLAISGFSAFVKNTTLSSTREKQVAIKDTLISYLRANGRLPCPDTGPPGSTGISTTSLPDGIENRVTPGNATMDCQNNGVGIVPYATLGLPRESAIDAWGNYFTYVVSNNFSPENPTATPPIQATPLRDWVKSATFRTGNFGDIEVLDDSASSLQAAALLISYGPNGAGAWTTKGSLIDSAGIGANEGANAGGCPRDATSGLKRCYKREFTDNSEATGGAFDDVVYVITPDLLLAPLYAQAVKYPPEADFWRQCSDIKDTLAKAGFANRTVVPGVPSAPPYTTQPYVSYKVTVVDPDAATSLTDPFGPPIPCPTSTTDITSSSLPRTLCTFRSKGPNALPAYTDDDLACTITVGDLQLIFAKTGF